MKATATWPRPWSRGGPAKRPAPLVDARVSQTCVTGRFPSASTVSAALLVPAINDIKRDAMTTPSERYGTRTRQLVAAATIGAIGAPLLIVFLVFVWAPVQDQLPALGSLPVIVMLAAPIGLLAGMVSLAFVRSAAG